MGSLFLFYMLSTPSDLILLALEYNIKDLYFQISFLLLIISKVIHFTSLILLFAKDIRVEHSHNPDKNRIIILLVSISTFNVISLIVIGILSQLDIKNILVFIILASVVHILFSIYSIRIYLWKSDEELIFSYGRDNDNSVDY